MVSLTIDGRDVDAPAGTLVIEAARRAGIDIPHLCYHPELSPSGGCRLCLVEVAGHREPVASCGLACGDGMVVSTDTDRLRGLRREVLDLFLSDHPVACVDGHDERPCDLRRLAGEHGLTNTTHRHELSRTLVQDDNPFFIRDHEACILCGRCVRVCDEIVGRNAIEFAGRGFASHIATPFDGPLIDSTCVFCGSCVQVCPTGALWSKSRIGAGRAEALASTRTICGYCGVGCSIEYLTKDGAIVEGRGFSGAAVNGEMLCVKGRYGWDFDSSPDRLTRPLVRRDIAESLGIMGEGEFVPVDWDTALDLVARRLREIRDEHGPDALAGLASARCTNEENYLFQKLFRATLGTNNVDHCARLCHSSSVTGLGMAFGSGAMTNPIRDIRDADCLLITGSNTAESHPVIGYEVVRAVKRGANLIVIDPRRVPMVDHATMFLQPRPGTDIHVFLAMAHVIVREGWHDAEFLTQRCEGQDELIASLGPHTPEVAELASGVPAADIERAARLYSLGERCRGASIFGDDRGHSAILYAMGITQRTNGTELVLSLANLAMLCGQLGKPSTGVNPLRGQSNVQGSCDMGALPNVLPGYQPVTDSAARDRVATHWGRARLPETPGLTVVEMTESAREGRIRGMFIMGENPMLSDPHLAHVEEGLSALDFLVVQDIFPTETTRLAHVILPAASSLEKDGTMTNTERRVQRLQPVLAPPGEARPDWWIILELARRLGEPWAYDSTAAIMDEIARATPSYGGISHERLSADGLCWPCPSVDHPGTPILHIDRFTRGRGKLHVVPPREPAEQPDDEYPLVLTTGRILYHYHTGTMTRRSEGLHWREPRAFAELHPSDAARAGVRDGGIVVIRGRRGTVRAQARVGEAVQPGLVFLSFHWREAAANALTQDFALDPYAKIPEYKICAVRIERPAATRA